MRTTLTRPGAFLTIAALMTGCDQTAALVAASEAASTVISAASAVDTLHSTQQTTGGAVDGSRMAQALSICLDNVPNMGPARQAMQLAGFKYEANIQGQDLYSAADRSVFALISVGTDRPRCAVGRDGLRGEPAVAFAERALRQAYGPAIIPIPAEAFDEPVLAGWVVERPTGILGIGVTPAISLPPWGAGRVERRRLYGFAPIALVREFTHRYGRARTGKGWPPAKPGPQGPSPGPFGVGEFDDDGSG